MLPRLIAFVVVGILGALAVEKFTAEPETEPEPVALKPPTPKEPTKTAPAPETDSNEEPESGE